MKTKSAYAMYMAHHLYRNRVNTSNTWSQIVEYAWYFIRLREALKNGVVRFSYFKQDCSIREARGTLCATLIPMDKLPKGKPIEVDERPNYKSIPYYDLDRCEWRAFSITKFIGFVEVFELVEGQGLNPHGNLSRSQTAKEKKNQKKK